MNAAAVILAGGASRRMGTPKALLEYRGETFLDRLIGLFEPFCSSVIVVLGHEPDVIRAGVHRHARFIVNPDYQQGQLTSLQCGLQAALDGPIEAVLFTPVDLPAIETSTVAALVAAFDPAIAAAVPRHGGRNGHPVCISPELIGRFLSLPPGSTAREVMHAAAAQTRYVDVDDPGILRDIDNREDYRKLIA